MLTLVLGGARSGKSRQAEFLAAGSGKPVTCVATATAGDDEMRQRIERHRASRPAHWTTVEEPIELASVLRANDSPNRCHLVDCLTLWLTNLLLADDPAVFTREREALLLVLSQLQGDVILVSNEVGQGIVAADPLSRRFVDEAGFLHQAIAAISDRVLFTIAGLPLELKKPASN